MKKKLNEFFLKYLKTKEIIYIDTTRAIMSTISGAAIIIIEK